MRSSSSSLSGRSTKRLKANPKTPIRRSPFTDFGNYMEAKNSKLRAQFEAEVSNSSLLNGMTAPSGNAKGIFHGVSIFVDGHTVPSSQELKGYMLRYGGRFENYFSRSRVTHIICSNLPDAKIRNLRAFSRGLPVLNPGWVVDSVAANKLLSWPRYQLTEHLSEFSKQKKLSAFFGYKQEIEVASYSKEETYPEASENFMKSSLPLENSLSDDRIEPGIDKEEKDYSLLDKEIKIESDSSSAHLPIQSKSHAGEGPGPSGMHHSTLTDPNFVENYFKHSRLHFIGAWKNRYQKRFCNILNGECSKVNIDSSSSPNKTSIIHIDMDCFFVSVILRKYPELLDKPVAVCHSNNSRGTSEISSANYPARSYGIRAGMFVRDAMACCPNLVVFPYDFGAYEEVADQFYTILHKHCNKVQAVSCDEAFLDVSELGDLDPESFASMIRKEIMETTQCTATAGIGCNLLMSRLATKMAKPDGLCVIPPEKVDDFLEDLPVMTLPGIGRSIGDKLESKQIHTCGQLRIVSKETLHEDFGAKVGDMLWNYCRGIDDRKVEVLKERKSIGADVNWGVRFLNSMDFDHFLNNLSKEVSSRLQECGVVAHAVSLKLKRRRKGAKEPVKFLGCGDCENMSRSMALPVATDDATLIQKIAKQIFASYQIDVKEIRGVGLQMQRLEIMGTNREVHKHNVLESWLTVSPKMRGESLRLDNRNDKTESLSSVKEDQATSSGAMHVNLCNSRSYESDISGLPPASLLDLSVIKDLPDEIISEMNNAYSGKLYDLMMKHDENQKSNVNLLSTSHELKHPENAEVSEMSLHRVNLLNNLQTNPTTSVNQMHSASGSSGKDSESVANQAGQEVSISKINLWSGSPPTWVDNFEASDCLILKLTAQLYTECGKDGLLSPVLQQLISLYPHISGSSKEPAEVGYHLCDLLLQYIDLKIESDIEELYLCCLLLERLASVSAVFSEVHSFVLPSIQVSVREIYGGSLQLLWSGG